MLYSTFLHFQGIGQKTEKMLWNREVLNWDALQDALKEKALPGLRISSPLLEEQLVLSREKLAKKEAPFFAARLPTNQMWRIFGDFRGLGAYLDIETTGLSYPYNHITTIALYDGEKLRYYIWGENLKQFVEDIQDYSLIITYNGKCFDLPFLQRQFNQVFPQAHLDLRYVLAGLGYKGGLKGCEKALGIDRGDLKDVDGYMAVLLWQEYIRHKDVRALETLLSYNMEDTVNLEMLACLAYNRLIEHTPFSERRMLLPESSAGEIVPFKPARDIIDRLKQRFFPGRMEL